MQKGKNNVHIACTLECINEIKECSSHEKQNEGFWVMKRLLTKDEEFKQKFIHDYGEEVWREMVKHYSKTNIEQRAERKLKEEAAKIRQDARDKIEAVKVAFLNAETKVMIEGKADEILKPKLTEEELKAKKEQLSKMDFKDPNWSKLKAEIDAVQE